MDFEDRRSTPLWLVPYKQKGEGRKEEEKQPQIPQALLSEYYWSQLHAYFPVMFSSQHKYTWK